MNGTMCKEVPRRKGTKVMQEKVIEAVQGYRLIGIETEPSEQF